MRGLADEPQDVPLDPVGADHRAGGSAHRLEHRPLLDVQLEVGARTARDRARAAPRACGPRRRRSRPARRRGARPGDPPGCARCRARAAAGARRPQQAAREARALFVGEVHDGQRHGRRPAGVAAERLDARQHAERAVEPAAVGHRVEVAADDDGLRSCARQRDPVVAGDVGLGAQSFRASTVVEPAACVTPHRTPRHPLGAMGVARPRRQGTEVGNQPTPWTSTLCSMQLAGALVSFSAGNDVRPAADGCHVPTVDCWAQWWAMCQAGAGGEACAV